MIPLLVLLSVLGRDGLTGTIQSADQKPIPTAVVSVVQDGRTTTVSVDAHGAFSLPAIKLPVTIEVKADGFTTVRQVADTSPVTVTLAPSPIRESIVVSDTARTDECHRPATGTTVISAETMAALPGVTADETLRTIAGLTLFRRSTSRASNPTTQGVTMRGLSASGSSRGLVLLDGIPFNDGFGGWVTWTRLPRSPRRPCDRSRRGGRDVRIRCARRRGRATWTGDRRNAQAGSSSNGGAGRIRRIGRRAHGRGHVVRRGQHVHTDGVIPVAPDRAAVDVRRMPRGSTGSPRSRGRFAG
jgi:hypothetical protein